MKEIPLTRGYVTVVDDEDYERFGKMRWYASSCRSGKVYAVRAASRSQPGPRILFLHREILKAKAGQIVDHKDGDGLHNRRSNLRLCTFEGNARNVKKQRDSKTPYKGVRRSSYGFYNAYIRVNGRTLHLGTFQTAEAAALTYNAKAVEAFGEFAALNQVQETKQESARNRNDSRRKRRGRFQYKGISQTPSGRYRAHIGYKGKQKNLGTFDTAEDAARAYNAAAKRLHGDRAILNDVP